LLAFSFQNVPPAPGRQTSESVAQPPPPPGAPPAGRQDPGFTAWLPLLMVVPLVILLLFSNRSQAKKQAELIKGLQKGDRVITQGGLVGKLIETGDRYAKIEIAPGVKIEVLKTGLLGKDDAETAAQLEKK
jgi:preprotein translocase subunit YajC